MAKLTQKEEAFVAEYIKTGNATQSYRAAGYSVARMKDKTVWEKASRVLSRGKVRARIEEIKGKAVEKAVLDKAWVLDRLMRNARVCLGEETMRLKLKVKDEVTDVEVHRPDPAGANRALELLGKELTMFKERSVQEQEDGPNRIARDDERHARIVELLAKLGTDRTVTASGNGAAHPRKEELPGFRRLH